MATRLFNVLLFSLFFLFFNNAEASSTAIKKGRPLKVLSYNIHHANPPSESELIDLPAIAKVINESDADLVALQEIDINTIRSGKGINQIEELGRLTGMNFFFVKGIDFEGGEYGLGVLSKFPILKTDSLRLPMKEGLGGEPRVVAIITVEPIKGKPLVFASTHLDLKPEHRELQAKAIVEKLGNLKTPVILCGDFNAQPDSEVIAILDRSFKRSSILNGFTIPVINPKREIDFVMYSPEKIFKVKKHVVIDEPYPSDHLPVYVELSY